MSPSQAILEIDVLSMQLGFPQSVPLTLRGKPFAGTVYEAACTLVKGENLHVLLQMIGNGGDEVDFVYINPPYNTGGLFVYDDRRLTPRAGLWGRHTEWMSFMLPRLFLAKCLLGPKGVIAVSIDDYEYHRLKVLLDSVFGEENCLGTLVVCRSKNGNGGRANVAVNHEYVVLYGRSKSAVLRGIEENDKERYKRQDAHGLYTIDGLFRKKGDASLRSDRPNMHYPLFCSADGSVSTHQLNLDSREVWPVDSKGIERRWLWGKEKAEKDAWKLYASPRGVVYVKNYYSDRKRVKVRSLWDNPAYLTDRATTELKDIFGAKIFETPKPIEFMRDLISCCTDADSRVLDFFAGSGTTAQAVFELNALTGGNRRTVLVEHNHAIDTRHIAAASGFRFTSDITEQRLEKLKNSHSNFDYVVFEC